MRRPPEPRLGFSPACRGRARAETIDDYRQLISKYPGSLAAGNAQLMIAKLLKKEEDGKEEAKGELRTFLETYKDHPQRDQALFTLAGLLIEENNTADAASHLDTLIQEHPESSLVAYARLYKGDFAYAAEKNEEAAQYYSSVRADYAGTPGQLASQRLNLIKIDKPTRVEPKSEPAPETTDPAGTDAIPSIIKRPDQGAEGTASDDTPAEGDATALPKKEEEESEGG